MWASVGKFVFHYRKGLVGVILLLTAWMGYHASKVEMSYDFTRAIPSNHPQYKLYQAFRKKFGEDGNLMVIALQSDRFFTAQLFNDYGALVKELQALPAVENVLSIPGSIQLIKDSSTQRLVSQPIFPRMVTTQQELDSARTLFERYPFYEGLLYNPRTGAYLMGIRIRKEVLNSKKRNAVVQAIVQAGDRFAAKHQLELHYSGLPLIRTNLATKVAQEMQWFLLGSLLLSAIILYIFFRSISTMLLSLAVVLIGVVWSLGTLHGLGYKITLLNALVPPLIVVIGIPNCIYFLNKYHTSYRQGLSKQQALVEMISRMGVVTLFCNIAAAIGFAVFALTESAILKEFGQVAGINIMALFFISGIVIPATLNALPDPKHRHTRYLESKWLLAILDRLERWCLHHQRLIYGITAGVLVISILGIVRLRSEGFIVDDLPQSDPIYKDLKFLEQHFKGVMPLEIIVHSKQKRGIVRNLKTLEAMDSFSRYIAAYPEMARPLSVVEGLKFARQAYLGGDPSTYAMPNSFDMAFLADYLNKRGGATKTKQESGFQQLLGSFLDSSRQEARISVNMADVGSRRLPVILQDLEQKSQRLFDSATYQVNFTGTSVTFLQGSAFIIQGLKDSILWAFLLIAVCMLYLFRSLNILVASLIPNLIPLVITGGVMGWVGVPLKPSTVLVFSVALGIAIDITIRFLVNYKQELHKDKSPSQVVIETIHKTGISIIYTSLVLIAGFVIFCFS
ncbi:MAG: efflux RND transporter permease subunit, partial [Chitinophagaceae bacterium]